MDFSNDLNRWLQTEEGKRALAMFETGSELRQQLKLQLSLAFLAGVSVGFDYGMQKARESFGQAIESVFGKKKAS